jgi:hypothetical protein
VRCPDDRWMQIERQRDTSGHLRRCRSRAGPRNGRHLGPGGRAPVAEPDLLGGRRHGNTAGRRAGALGDRDLESLGAVPSHRDRHGKRDVHGDRHRLRHHRGRVANHGHLDADQRVRWQGLSVGPELYRWGVRPDPDRRAGRWRRRRGWHDSSQHRRIVGRDGGGRTSGRRGSGRRRNRWRRRRRDGSGRIGGCRGRQGGQRRQVLRRNGLRLRFLRARRLLRKQLHQQLLRVHERTHRLVAGWNLCGRLFGRGRSRRRMCRGDRGVVREHRPLRRQGGL